MASFGQEQVITVKMRDGKVNGKCIIEGGLCVLAAAHITELFPEQEYLYRELFCIDERLLFVFTRGSRYRAYLECSTGNYDDVFSPRLLALRPSPTPARCISFHSCYTTHTIVSPPLILLLHISVPLALLNFPTPQAPLVVAASCPTLPATLTQLYVLILLLLRSPAHSLLHVSPHTLLAVLFTTTTFIHFI